MCKRVAHVNKTIAKDKLIRMDNVGIVVESLDEVIVCFMLQLASAPTANMDIITSLPSSPRRMPCEEASLPSPPRRVPCEETSLRSPPRRMLCEGVALSWFAIVGRRPTMIRFGMSCPKIGLHKLSVKCIIQMSS